MFDSQNLAPIAAIVADPRFPAALVVAVISGLVRGFSGFGSALIHIPLISAVYNPQIAAATLLVIDSLSGLPFAIKAMPQANWREVIPVSIAGIVGVPCGALVLLWVDTQILRWIIAGMVLFALATLMSGWRYHGRPTVGASLATGAAAGFGAGAVQIGVPPLLIFWLGGNNSAATVRANIMVYFIPQAVMSYVMYAIGGLFTAQSLILSLLLGLPFLAATAAGARWFRGASDTTYRRVAYLIIAVAGLISLPVFDQLR